MQRGRGDVYPIELECVSYRIDECDDIMRKDCDVIQEMFGRCIDLGGEGLLHGEGIAGKGAHHPYGGDTKIFQPYQSDPTFGSSREIQSHDNEYLVVNYVHSSDAESLVCDGDRSRSKWMGLAVVKVQ